MKLLVFESVYWVNMNAHIENTVKQCAICQDYHLTEPHEKAIPYDILCKPWEVVGADILSIDNTKLLCIVDYNSKYSFMKKTDVFQLMT